MIEPNEQQQPEPRGDAEREKDEGSRGSERETDQPDGRWWENPGPQGEVH